MNLTSSHPFWLVNNGLPANYTSLQRNVSCDAVVIGGGITGGTGAVQLAEAGVKALVAACGNGVRPNLVRWGIDPYAD